MDRVKKNTPVVSGDDMSKDVPVKIPDTVNSAPDVMIRSVYDNCEFGNCTAIIGPETEYEPVDGSNASGLFRNIPISSGFGMGSNGIATAGNCSAPVA